MIAVVDESMRSGAGSLYLVATVMVPERPTQVQEIQEVIRSIPVPGQHRFHWRPDSESQRLAMLALIAELGLVARAYVLQPVVTHRQDRARALCVNRLLWDLGELGVDQVVFESREEHNDRKDRLTVLRAQKATRAPDQLRYVFRRPNEEPLLWLADAMAGAVSARFGDDDEHYLQALDPDQVRVVTVVP
ncbi:MAG: hypothetical protein ACRD0J_17345 [Acidimicrobiales bacterium]